MELQLVYLFVYSNTTLVKVKLFQNQELIRLYLNSNTTLVKVKLMYLHNVQGQITYSNTTLVKVKYNNKSGKNRIKLIQIQLLLKLNARKISICDFHYTIKSIDIQGY